MYLIIAYFKNGAGIIAQGASTQAFNADLKANVEQLYNDPKGLAYLKAGIEVSTLKLGTYKDGRLRIVSQDKLDVSIGGEIRIMLDGKDYTSTRFETRE